MNKTLKDSLDVIWYFMAFFLIQFIMIWAVRIGTNLATGQPLIDAANAASRPNGDALVLMMLFSSILTILVFGQFRWSPWSRDYLRSKPWLVVVWTIILSLGTILPSEWILESLQVRMSEAQVQMFEQIMGKPMGYIAIGILAPIAEEMCFRGAILRKLLTMFPKRQHWIAIAVSAVLFALAHFNVVQSLHAFLIGLLLGWLYYRTDSILHRDRLPLDQQHGGLRDVQHHAADGRRQAHRHLPRQPHGDAAGSGILAVHYDSGHRSAQPEHEACSQEGLTVHHRTHSIFAWG